MIEETKSTKKSEIEVSRFLKGGHDSDPPSAVPGEVCPAELDGTEFPVRFQRQSRPNDRSRSVSQDKDARFPSTERTRFEGINQLPESS